MKYNVAVKEISYGSVTVEARNPKDAMEKAEQAYYSGDVYWDSSDFEATSVQREKNRGDAR